MKHTTRAIFAALLILGIVFLAGCGPALTQGVVVSKEYRAPYTSTWYYSMKVGDSAVLMPMSDDHPAAWEIVVENDAGDRDRWAVDATFYDRVRVGDAIRRNDERGISISEG